MDDLLEHFYLAVPFTTSGYFTSGFRASYVVIVESRQKKAASSRDDGRENKEFDLCFVVDLSWFSSYNCCL